MRAVTIPLWVVLLLAAGCITQPDREAIVGGAQVLQDRGEKGDAEAGAAAEALWQVAADTDAVTITEQGQVLLEKVNPATVDTSVPASKARAARIASDRAARGMVQVFIGTFLSETFKQLPWGGTAVGLGGALWALWRKGQVQRVAGALSGVLDACKANTYQPGDTAQALADAGANPKLAESIRQSAKG